MNAAQIAKLRRKVDTQVSAKVKKREAEEQEKKDAICRTLVLLQKENPDRGGAVASYKGCPYCIVGGVLTDAGLLNNQDFELMEVSGKGTPDEVRYWFFKLEVYKAQTKLNDWMIKNSGGYKKRCRVSDSYVAIRWYICCIHSGVSRHKHSGVHTNLSCSGSIFNS
jgi:hypothetical protein